MDMSSAISWKFKLLLPTRPYRILFWKQKWLSKEIKPIPIVNGKLGLSTWQNIFVCEFDGPRTVRNIVVTIVDCEK